MEFIKEWITNIILFILIATIIDMLLPKSNLQKYTKMVTGLLLIAVILTPIFKFVSKDFEEALANIPVFEAAGDKKMENLIEMQKKEIQASNDAYILENMAVQLQRGVEEELMEQYGLEIANIKLEAAEKDEHNVPILQQVIVRLKPMEEEAAVEVAAIQPVEINTSKPHETVEKSAEADSIATMLSENWNVEMQLIEVMIEGGIAKGNE